MEKILQEFDKLPLIPTIDQSEEFFRKITIGNTSDNIDRPYERFHGYRELLSNLLLRDKAKYIALHKGTPFFFLAWTAYDLEDNDLFMYFLDCAISEDAKNIGVDIRTPALNILFLEKGSSADRIVTDIKSFFNRAYTPYEKMVMDGVSMDDFIKQMVIYYGKTSELRTFLVAIYAFILNYKKYWIAIELKPNPEVSISPLIKHLQSGVTILESIIKDLYKHRNFKDLGSALNDSEFKKDFPKVFEDGLLFDKVNNKNISQIIAFIDSYSSNPNGINLDLLLIWSAYGIRNLVNHNIVANFSADDYKKLFNIVLQSIIHITKNLIK